MRASPVMHVYVVRCSDGSYYVGSTTKEPDARVWEHNNLPSEKGYTAKRRPVALVFSEDFERYDDAVARERQIKGWSRAKKEALFRRDYEALPALASRKAK